MIYFIFLIGQHFTKSFLFIYWNKNWIIAKPFLPLGLLEIYPSTFPKTDAIFIKKE